MSASAPWRTTRDGAAIRVRLTPRSSKDAIERLEDTADGRAVRARVRAVPEAGAANAALERLVASWLGVARTSVKLSAGGKSRVKVLDLNGDPDQLAALLQRKCAELA